MAAPSRAMRIARSFLETLVASAWWFAFLALTGLLGALAAGCGAGALIGGAAAGAVITLNDGSSSGPDTVPEVSSVTGPTREETQASGDATRIPLIIDFEGDLSEVTVQYALFDSEDDWQTATLASGCVSPPEPSGQVWCWSAREDLRAHADLTTASERVKVRAFFRDQEARAKQSRSFLVGNSLPEVILEAVFRGSDVAVSFRLLDAENDPLLGPDLTYRVDEVEGLLCEPPVGCEPCTAPTPVGETLQADSTQTFFWRSHCAKGIGRRNVDIVVTLEGEDHFGNRRGAEEHVTVRNNRPPEVDSLASQDRSFEIPLLFQLFERDCGDPEETDCVDFQPVDVIVQYDPEGRLEFESLDGAFGAPENRFDRREFRRRILDPASPDFDDFVELRRLLRIATPHASRPAAGQLFDLAASPEGIQHTFLWDSMKDVQFSSLGTVALRITPFDDETGFDDTAAILVDNDFYPNPEPMLEDRRSIGGIAFGDLDGDGRDDEAYSLTEEGEVMVRLSRAAGAPPLPLTRQPPSPIELKIDDLDGDGWQDLVVLNRRCSIGTCRERGAIEIHFGSSGTLGDDPPVILDAGRDARSICVGNFDGREGLDIAVSNRDDADVGVYLSTGARSFTVMHRLSVDVTGIERPGGMACADFDRDGLDEFAVRLREAHLVNIYEWDEAAMEIREVGTTEVRSPASLDTGDFDGDGWIDLAVGSREWPYIHILANTGQDPPGRKGSNSFTRLPCPELELEGRAELLGVAPLAESQADVYLFATAGDDTTDSVELVRVRFSGRECSEVTLMKQLPFPQPSNASNLRGSLAVRDFDGDGLVDVFVGGRDGALFLGAEGPGSLTEGPMERLALPGVDALAFADVSCNSLTGIVAVNLLRPDANGNIFYEASLLLQDRLTGFPRTADWVSESQPALEPEVFVSTGDRGADGCSDVIAVSRKGGIDFFLGNDAAFATRPRSLEIVNPSAVPFALGAFGGDEGLDILTLEVESGALALRTVAFPEEAETLAVEEHPELRPTGLPDPSRLLTGDVDGDGLLDVVVTHKDFDQSDFDQSREALVLLRQIPDARWPLNFVEETAPELPAGLFLELGDTALLVDVNSDGRDDLVFAGSRKPLGVFLSTGKTGSLYPEPSAPSSVLAAPLDGARIDSIAVVDLSDDGRPDVVLSSRSGQDAVLSVLFQRQNGTLPSAPSRTLVVRDFGEGVVQIAIADLTNDSRPEIVVFGANANATWIGRSR